MTEDLPARLSLNIQSNESLARLQTFRPYLSDRGHAPSTTGRYLRCAEHFERWAASARVETMSEAAVAVFLKDHLPSCRCPSPGPRARKEVRAALHHYLAVLRRDDLIPPPPSPTLSAVEKELRAFERYLIEVCGVALATRTGRLRWVRDFLAVRYGAGPVDARTLKPSDIMKYLAGQAAVYKPQTAKTIASSVRSYLRFLVLTGIVDNRMPQAVPTIPVWRMSSLPRVLSTVELDRFLSSFDVSTPAGCRDYAMASCLVEWGLRTGEVALLRLDDINWREGTVRIAGRKSHRERILPLTSGAGGAIADYLRNNRPKADERALFLRQGVLAGTPVTPHIVRGVVRRAYARAGILSLPSGPHILRHTLATQMLEQGAPLTEVADVLGHGTIDTTAIYAKVNLTSLARVAMPWPEVRP